MVCCQNFALATGRISDFIDLTPPHLSVGDDDLPVALRRARVADGDAGQRLFQRRHAVVRNSAVHHIENPQVCCCRQALQRLQDK